MRFAFFIVLATSAAAGEEVDLPVVKSYRANVDGLGEIKVDVTVTVTVNLPYQYRRGVPRVAANAIIRRKALARLESVLAPIFAAQVQAIRARGFEVVESQPPE